ncbi:MAG TPA: PfaD family polyunsaturated fatty acid/polyketide biosynthesis protein, partial [Opitutaceae bacterium]
GEVVAPRMILGKVSRPEVAGQFLRPAPAPLLAKLVASGAITANEAELAQRMPMADDVCVEADSGGHTDRGVAYALLPVMLSLRDELSRTHGYARKVGIGAAGGLGTPEAVAASFVMGADFVLTGSVNQCTVESGASEMVKDMLQEAEVQDMDIVPAGDMFEMGAKVQVYKRGLLFPGRAKKLYELYKQFDSLEQIDAKTREQIEARYFKRTFEAVWAETREFYLKRAPATIERAERDPKHKMALIFRWYFVHTSRVALRGEAAERTDFQIHSGPALGSFNRFVKGRPEESWRNRHVDGIADLLMQGAAELLGARFRALTGD